MADHHPERGPCRPLKVQKGKQTQRARVARKSRTPEEVYLRRRPTRPMPIPTSKRKPVQDPCLSPGSPGRKPEVTSPAPPFKKAEGNACSPSGLNRGRGVPVTDTPQPAGTRFVQDATHSVQQTQNKPHSVSSTNGLSHTLMPQAQARFPDGNSTSMPHPAAQSGCQDSNLSTKAPGKRVAQTSIQLGHKARKKRRLWSCQSPQKSTQTADLQPPHVGPLAKTLQPCQLPPSPPIPCQPIRMAFRRFQGGQWSCRLVTAPSIRPAEKAMSAVQSPPHLGRVRGTPAQGPWSVLHEDLQLSSSSEESDGQ
ncbi:putative protein FAM90A26 [Myotis myotis]|uniref:Uncharacterized protein n=1 Tax=Myotis myotis TaxID=51298 RepID=A0A7J7Y1C4_MYOMY|nr:putative protein FAM90A26 [Myotis myotis]KAF6355360.1 hypothetical protein mMyoMyo1_011522 [Myotis myotis]